MQCLDRKGCRRSSLNTACEILNYSSNYVSLYDLFEGILDDLRTVAITCHGTSRTDAPRVLVALVDSSNDIELPSIERSRREFRQGLHYSTSLWTQTMFPFDKYGDLCQIGTLPLSMCKAVSGEFISRTSLIATPPEPRIDIVVIVQAHVCGFRRASITHGNLETIVKLPALEGT
jgi:hypothetical protein